MSTLPKQVQDQLEDSNSLQDRLESHAMMHPRVGRPPKQKLNGKSLCIVADSELALNNTMAQISVVLGVKARGNKRHAYKALYADLTQYFMALRSCGVSLPRKYLNLESCSDHLAEILHRHGYLSKADLDAGAIYTQETRDYLSNTLGRIFSRISDSLTPCNNP